MKLEGLVRFCSVMPYDQPPSTSFITQIFIVNTHFRCWLCNGKFVYLHDWKIANKFSTISFFYDKNETPNIFYRFVIFNFV